MGQGQSRDDGARADGAPRTCYYELLEIPMTASDGEIRKAYRKKALELHPDRNYGNSEDSTRLFAEVQTAYEVLSNPHERAWYDAHRDEILHGAVPGSGEDHYEANVRVTTAEDITQMYMGFDGGLKFDDSDDGFFTELRKFFERLSLEEQLACEQQGEEYRTYPSFGHAQASYEEEVRPFYSVWSGFATTKTFAWKNIYRLSEAPERRTRRWMDKENRKAREQGVRDFNAAVRALVSFVRRRDPRVVRATVAAPGEDLHDALRKQAAQQAAKARQANQAAVAEYVAPSWAQSESTDPHEGVIEDDEEPEETEVLECIVCNKIFKSEPQYEAHEQSKKHRKAVHDMERQMRKENRALGLDIHTSTSGIVTPAEDDQVESPSLHDDDVDAESLHDTRREASHDTHEQTIHSSRKTSDVVSESQDTSHESKLITSPELQLDSSPSLHSSATSQESDAANDLAVRLDLRGIYSSEDEKTSSAGATAKPGKAKQRRAKKEARNQVAGAKLTAAHQCNVCAAEFDSKTRLFTHIRDTGHARAAPGAAAQGTGGRAGKTKKK